MSTDVSPDAPTVVDYDVSTDVDTHDGKQILIAAERGEVSAVIAAPPHAESDDVLDCLEEIAESYETIDEIVRRSR